MKIRHFITTMFASLTLLAAAQTESDPMYMVLTMRNGNLKAIDIATVNRMTFPNGNMIVENKNSTTEKIDLTEISQMKFSNNETDGIHDVVFENSNLVYNPSSCTLFFEGFDGKEICIYNVNGILMLRQIVCSGNIKLDLSALMKDTYIATYNGQSIKFVK